MDTKIVIPMIQRLQKFGSSLEISWGEDDNLWAVSWITGGVRFTTSSGRLDTALQQVWLASAAKKLDDNTVYSQPECPFNYCANPGLCKELGKCQHS